MTDQTTVWASLALSQTVGYCIPWINPNTFQPTVDSTFFFTPSTVTGTVGLLTVPSLATNVANTPLTPLVRNASKLGSSGFGWGSINLDYFLASVAGAATVNKPCGSAIIAAGVSFVTITNSLVTVNSIVFAQLAFLDATLLYIKAVTTANGSFTILGIANATVNTKVNWLVINTDS